MLRKMWKFTTSDIPEFIASLPTASTPDSRWGSIQIVLAISFFFLGVTLAMLSIDDKGKTTMIIGIIALFFGISILLYAIILGTHYYNQSKKDEIPILVVTKNTIKTNTEFERIVNNTRIIKTDRYEIIIKDLTAK